MAVIVDLEKCTGCGTCEEGCPVEASKWRMGRPWWTKKPVSIVEHVLKNAQRKPLVKEHKSAKTHIKLIPTTFRGIPFYQRKVCSVRLCKMGGKNWRPDKSNQGWKYH
jgi:ferredoxin